MILNGKIYSHQERLARARTEILSELLLESADGPRGGRNYKALFKALDELEANDSLEFDGTRLIFRSRFSGRLRRVTEAGCARICECRGRVSYHKYIFAILARLAELEKMPVGAVKAAGPPILKYDAGNLQISLCLACGETAAGHTHAAPAAKNALAAEIAARHAGCRRRTPHPHLKAGLKKDWR